jgi:hypothetical protein
MQTRPEPGRRDDTELAEAGSTGSTCPKGCEPLLAPPQRRVGCSFTAHKSLAAHRRRRLGRQLVT